ncbi:hypothetical protein SLEP1_g38357 [Rubroshorea leprosula]|nr:hypothetical protein SLEP1_g38357 [Rubroshorea leprosula]
MMIIHKKSELLQKVDDTMAVLHKHAVAGRVGGILVGLFAEPRLNTCSTADKGTTLDCFMDSSEGEWALDLDKSGFMSCWGRIRQSEMKLLMEKKLMPSGSRRQAWRWFQRLNLCVRNAVSLI